MAGSADFRVPESLRLFLDVPERTAEFQKTKLDACIYLLNTCYGYDAQGNLTSVVQGSETRTYAYDGLSRLTSETTPEGGTTNYYYTTSGGSLCANNPNRICRKTDARSITTTYTYDAMDRLTGKSYSNGDTSVAFYYDQTSYNGLTISNGKGLRTGMNDGSGQTAWSYDTMGRVVAEERTIGTVTKTISYSYDVDGSMASVTYPSGRVVSYGYSNAGRPVSAVDSGNGINYATSATYAPPGGLSSVVSGKTGSFNGITASYGYNNRLFPTAITASSSNGTALSLSYSYFANGNVNVETNGRDNGRTATYGYDALNRLTSGASQATSGADCWGQSFAYDRYANLTTVNSTKTGCSAPILNLTVNANNRITNTGFAYDAAGNLTGDGVNTYAWNAEAHLTSAASVTYTYDGDLRRVKKSSGTLYWNTPAGSVLAESDLSGNLTSEYTFFEGRRIARRDVSSGSVYYISSDRLGSYRTLTDASGNVKGESDYYPFGAERVVSATVTDSFRFTGFEWDSEDGLNHTLYRQFTPAQGRWQTPDPDRGYVTNPQSLNRYAYATDNPTNSTDPFGLQGEGGGDSGCVVTNLDGIIILTCGSGSPSGGSGGGPCSLVEPFFGGPTPMSGNCPPGGSTGGGGKGSTLVHVSNLHKTGRDINTIKSRLDQILQCIDPKCLAFLQSGGRNLDTYVSDLLGNNLLAAGDVTPNSIDAFTSIGGSNVPDCYAVMVVNDNGDFFYDNYPVDEGNLVGGTPRAQAFILLHELGHLLNAKGYQDDTNNPTAGKANDKLIEKNCQATLKQFSSH